MLLQISNTEFNSEFNHPGALAHEVHNPNMKEGSIAQRADQENTASMLTFHIWVSSGAFHLSELASWTIAGPVSLQMKSAFFKGFLQKNHLLGVYYLQLD